MKKNKKKSLKCNTSSLKLVLVGELLGLPELVIEHLVRGCGWPMEHKQIICTCVPHEPEGMDPSGATMGLYKGKQWEENLSCT